MKGIKIISILFIISLILSCASDSSEDFINPIPDMVNYTNQADSLKINMEIAMKNGGHISILKTHG